MNVVGILSGFSKNSCCSILVLECEVVNAPTETDIYKTYTMPKYTHRHV